MCIRDRSVSARNASKSPSVQGARSVRSSLRKTEPSDIDTVSHDLMSSGQDAQFADNGGDKLFIGDSVSMKSPAYVAGVSDEQSGGLFKQSGHKVGDYLPVGRDEDTPSAVGVADEADVISVNMLHALRSSPRKIDPSGQNVEFIGAESDQMCISSDVTIDRKLSNYVKQSEKKFTPAAAVTADCDSSRKIAHTRRSSPRKMNSSGEHVKLIGAESGRLRTNGAVDVENKPLSMSSPFTQSDHTYAAVADLDSPGKTLCTRRSSPRKKKTSGLSMEQFVGAKNGQMSIRDDLNVDSKQLSDSLKHSEHITTPPVAVLANSDTSRKTPRTRRSWPKKTDKAVSSDTAGVRRSRKSLSAEKLNSLCMTDNDENKPLSNKEQWEIDIGGQNVNSVNLDNDRLCLSVDANVNSELFSSSFKQSAHISSSPAAGMADSDLSTKILRPRRSSSRKRDISCPRDTKSVIVDGDDISCAEKLLSSSFVQPVHTSTPSSAVDTDDSVSSRKMLRTRCSSLRKMRSVPASDPVGIRRRGKSVDAERESLRVTDISNKLLSTLSREQWKLDSSVQDVKSLNAGSDQMYAGDSAIVDNELQRSASTKMPRTRRSSPRKSDVQDVRSPSFDSDEMCVGDDVSAKDPKLTSTLSAAGAVDYNSSRKVPRTRRSSLRKADDVASVPVSIRRRRKSLVAERESLRMTGNEENKSLSTLSKQQWKIDSIEQDPEFIGVENNQPCISNDAVDNDESLRNAFMHPEPTSSLSAAATADCDSSRKLLHTRRSSPRKMDVSLQDVRSPSSDSDRMCVSSDVSVDDKLLNTSFKLERTSTPSSVGKTDLNSSRKMPRTRRCSHRKVGNIASDTVNNRRSRKSVDAEKELLSVPHENRPLSADEQWKIDSSGQDSICGKNSQFLISDDAIVSDEPLYNSLELCTTPGAGTVGSDCSKKMHYTRHSSPRKMDISSQKEKLVNAAGDQLHVGDSRDKLLSNSSTHFEHMSSPFVADTAESNSSAKILRTRRLSPRKIDVSVQDVKSVNVGDGQLPVSDSDNDKLLSNSSKQSEHASILSAVDTADCIYSRKTLRTRRSDVGKADGALHPVAICQRRKSISAERNSADDDDVKSLSTLSREQWEIDSSRQDMTSVNADSDQLHMSDLDNVDGGLLNKQPEHTSTSPVAGKTDCEHTSTSPVAGITDCDTSTNRLQRQCSSSPRKMDISWQDMNSAGENNQLCVNDDAVVDTDLLNSSFKQPEQMSIPFPSAADAADSESSAKMQYTQHSCPKKMDISGQDKKSVSAQYLSISDDVNVSADLLNNSIKQAQYTSPSSAADVDDFKSSRKTLRTRRSCLKKPDDVASDSVSGRRSNKFVGAEADSLHMADNDENTAAKELQSWSDEAVLLSDSAAKPAKKRTGVQNRRKSSCSGQPGEKRPRGRMKSLEPGLCRKSSAARGARSRKSEVGSIGAKVENDSSQNQRALEDSGRRLMRPRQCNTKPTPADDEGSKNTQTEDGPDLLQCDKDLASKQEFGDTDGSSTLATSSDDVRFVLLYNMCIYDQLLNFALI